VHSTQYFHDDDLAAVAAYLKTLAPAPGDAASFRADPATAQALRAGRDDSRGAELYIDNCAACHRSDGAGYARVFPRIAGNATALSADPTTLVRLILAGSRLPATAGAPSELAMPGYAWRLSDEEVATLATFVRQSWGNQAPAVRAGDVRAVRRELAQEGARR
jgi:alcohol dehydrogenase (quinone), cytochrome c subunit